ncbi:MAG: hypothetical protein ACREKE_03290, partial [bacterium]
MRSIRGGFFYPACLLCLFWALGRPAPLRADVPPGQVTLSGQLEGYGSVSMTATAPQGSAALAYISVTAELGGTTSWLADLTPGVEALPEPMLSGCGSVTLSAEAVDVNGEVGAPSADLNLNVPCGPEIASFSPNPSTATGEVLSWTPVSGQDSVAYVVVASPGPSAGVADPLPLVLTITGQTSYT